MRETKFVSWGSVLIFIRCEHEVLKQHWYLSFCEVAMKSVQSTCCRSMAGLALNRLSQTKIRMWAVDQGPMATLPTCWVRVPSWAWAGHQSATTHSKQHGHQHLHPTLANCYNNFRISNMMHVLLWRTGTVWDFFCIETDHPGCVIWLWFYVHEVGNKWTSWSGLILPTYRQTTQSTYEPHNQLTNHTINLPTTQNFYQPLFLVTCKNIHYVWSTQELKAAEGLARKWGPEIEGVIR